MNALWYVCISTYGEREREGYLVNLMQRQIAQMFRQARTNGDEQREFGHWIVSSRLLFRGEQRFHRIYCLSEGQHVCIIILEAASVIGILSILLHNL